MINSHKPGLPDYTGPTHGWFAYIHHDIQLEWSNNILEQVAEIVAQTPATEQAIRLACLTHIPHRHIPVACEMAWHACQTAGHTQEAYETARQAYETAAQASTVALAAMVKMLAPEAPWDGTQLIFEPRKVGPS